MAATGVTEAVTAVAVATGVTEDGLEDAAVVMGSASAHGSPVAALLSAIGCAATTGSGKAPPTSVSLRS